ncbi:MAG TPA: hypothetical protein VGF60_01035 [Xanthobacteraceae bacterium]|jgi:hypothetical protein
MPGAKAHRLRCTSLTGAISGAALLLAVGVLAQDGQSPPAGSPPRIDPPAGGAADPASPPGFIEALGNWLKDGAGKLKSDMQGAQDRLGKFGSQVHEAAKDATGTIIGWPSARPTSGRERCAPAANGAPDCLSAAVALCRGKGFQTGKSLDTQSEQKCPARVLLEGRSPNSAECPTHTFVTRALCQ